MPCLVFVKAIGFIAQSKMELVGGGVVRKRELHERCVALLEFNQIVQLFFYDCTKAYVTESRSSL
jgi:hypothetical protein